MHFVESLSRRLAVGCDFTGDSICDQADIIARANSKRFGPGFS